MALNSLQKCLVASGQATLLPTLERPALELRILCQARRDAPSIRPGLLLACWCGQGLPVPGVCVL